MSTTVRRRLGELAALCLVLACGCQKVFGDFEVLPAPAEEPSAVLGTECDPDAYRCTNELLETCSDDRSGFVVAETCPSAAECNLNARGCRACTAGERMCRENVLERCDDSLAWQVEATCATAALCNVAPDRLSGTCDTPVCAVPGAHACDGAKLVRCSEGRDRLEAVALCENPELCDAAHADELARSGARGRCRPALCEPNAYRCRGAVLEHCAIDRTAWNEVATCDSPDLCNAAGGACTACEPDAVECNGAELRRCTAESAWKTLATCDSVALCSASTASCLRAECDEPGALRCGSGGIPVLERCSEALLWEVAEVCATVELCSATAGRCLPPACIGGEQRCRGDRFERCSSDRTHWTPVSTCGPGELCEPETGCIEAVCKEADVRCNGSSLERCVAGRYEEVERCATADLCDENLATCNAAVCPAGPAFECRGSIIRKCRPGRDAFDDFRTCPADTTCDAIPGLATGLPECDVCTPNTYECIGAELVRCSSDGQTRETVSTCPTSCTYVAGGIPSCQ